MRLSDGRDTVLKRKTGYVIDKGKWSERRGLPKPHDENSKALMSKLKSLESKIITSLNQSKSDGQRIDSDWLERQIFEFNNGTISKNETLLVNYTQKFIDKLPYRSDSRGRKGVSKATVTKYTTILHKFIDFEKFTNRRYLIRDVDLAFRHDFLEYLTEVEQLGDNTAGRYLTFIKTILYDARKNGLEISHQVQDFKGFKVKPPIVILSFDEVDKIRKTVLDKIHLDQARDWLVIGCYTGQRVSDLLRMKKVMIEEVEGYRLISLTQVKTGKKVHIPIHPVVEEILGKRNGEFPDVVGKVAGSRSAKFNEYIKEVCRLAGLTEKTEGNLLNPKTKRKEIGNYPKWKLVSSHICRRSFASNFYSLREYPTPILMNITGHSTEAMFLEYIGKKPMDFSLQLAKTWNG